MPTRQGSPPAYSSLRGASSMSGSNNDSEGYVNPYSYYYNPPTNNNNDNNTSNANSDVDRAVESGYASPSYRAATAAAASARALASARPGVGASVSVDSRSGSGMVLDDSPPEYTRFDAAASSSASPALPANYVSYNSSAPGPDAMSASSSALEAALQGRPTFTDSSGSDGAELRKFRETHDRSSLRRRNGPGRAGSRRHRRFVNALYLQPTDDELSTSDEEGVFKVRTIVTTSKFEELFTNPELAQAFAPLVDTTEVEQEDYLDTFYPTPMQQRANNVARRRRRLGGVKATTAGACFRRLRRDARERIKESVNEELLQSMEHTVRDHFFPEMATVPLTVDVTSTAAPGRDEWVAVPSPLPEALNSDVDTWVAVDDNSTLAALSAPKIVTPVVEPGRGFDSDFRAAESTGGRAAELTLTLENGYDRFLFHCVANYYGLNSRSEYVDGVRVTTASLPARMATLPPTSLYAYLTRAA